jgi:hypothetical protein
MYYYTEYTLTTCTNQMGYSGFHIDYIHEQDSCGYVYGDFYCSYHVDHNYYCQSAVTTKVFYEFTGGSEPFIIKPELNQFGNDMCYDQSQYFCGSTSCLPAAQNSSSWSWANYCPYEFNGFGAACPQNATCSNGKYVCDPGFKDVFHLDHLSVDPNDCTACEKPRGCVPDDTVFPPTNASVMNVQYNVTNSFSNLYNYASVSIGNVCGKNITINGCTDDQFGDQFIEFSVWNSRYGANDDAYPWRICSQLKPDFGPYWACDEAEVRLGCFGSSNCGGTVEITVGDPCPPNTYSKNGFRPCIACPPGLTTMDIGATQCTYCAEGYIGFNGTAPCVACPDGTVGFNHSSCEVCSIATLDSMPDDYTYVTCLAQLLRKVVALEQRVDVMTNAVEQYLADVKHGMPTVHPTLMPTRRRRSRAPIGKGL